MFLCMLTNKNQNANKLRWVGSWVPFQESFGSILLFKNIIIIFIIINVILFPGEFRLDPVDVFLGIPYALPPIGPRRCSKCSHESVKRMKSILFMMMNAQMMASKAQGLYFSPKLVKMHSNVGSKISISPNIGSKILISQNICSKTPVWSNNGSKSLIS